MLHGRSHHLRRLRCRLKTLICWIVVIYSVVAVKPFIFPWQINIQDWDFTEHNKCPACFGESLCPDLYHNKIVLTNWTRFTISRLYNHKNYFHANFRGQKVILKKLASEHELKRLDRQICEMTGQSPDHCHPGHYIKVLSNSFSDDSAPVSSLSYEKMKKFIKFKPTEVLDCLESQKLIDILVSRSRYYPEGVASDENILTLLSLNPEPLIFMAFSKEEGWDFFPNYLGSCGRLAVFANAGEILTHQLKDKPWKWRVKVARQLLIMAKKMTDNEDRIGLYLTDWSPDNFVVDKFGSLTLIDGENFILVDQDFVRNQGGPGWNVNHTSNVRCPNNFCYASADLCTHVYSDLNFYGLCTALLSPRNHNYKLIPGGILHSIPQQVLRKHPLISRLIEECAAPTHPGGRYEAVKELLEILKEL